MSDYLEGWLFDERWVSYPLGMKFPMCFSQIYPFRGRGVISKILFVANRLGLDKKILRHTSPPIVGALEDVAFFWPSAVRSEERFYGYKIKNGTILEYWKIATSEKERKLIVREAENVEIVSNWQHREFKVPKVLGFQEYEGAYVIRYSVLPVGAVNLPLSAEWEQKVEKARKFIFEQGYAHGDFGWHNLKRCGMDLWILDWESLEKTENILIDVIYHNISYYYYWKKKPLKEVAQRVIDDASKYFCEKEKIDSALDFLSIKGISKAEELKRYICG